MDQSGEGRGSFSGRPESLHIVMEKRYLGFKPFPSKISITKTSKIKCAKSGEQMFNNGTSGVYIRSLYKT